LVGSLISTTGIDINAVVVGRSYEVTSPLITYNALIELKPRFQWNILEVENPIAAAEFSWGTVKSLYR